MIKRLFTLFAVLFALIAFVVPAQADVWDMWAYVYTWDGNRNTDGKPVLTRATSGISFAVLQRNSDTLETLYEPLAQDATSMTSLTNPSGTTNYASNTVCNDRVAFRVDPGETNDRYVDLIVTNTVGGYTTFFEDFDRWQHTIVIDQRPGVIHHGIVRWDGGSSGGSGATTNTGVYFLYDTKIHDVMMETVTVSASSTHDVGLGLTTETSYDVDGFVDGVSTATAGNIVLSATTMGDFVESGDDQHGHVIEGANAITLTYQQVTGSALTGDGWIHYWFTRMR